MIKSSNPALGKNTFARYDSTMPAAESMTVNGTINKTVIMLVLVMIPAYWVWNMFYEAGVAAVMPWLYGGLIFGLIITLVWLYIEFLRLLSKIRQ